MSWWHFTLRLFVCKRGLIVCGGLACRTPQEREVPTLVIGWTRSGPRGVTYQVTLYGRGWWTLLAVGALMHQAATHHHLAIGYCWLYYYYGAPWCTCGHIICVCFYIIFLTSEWAPVFFIYIDAVILYRRLNRWENFTFMSYVVDIKRVD